mgnify:CR=1 FL=1
MKRVRKETTVLIKVTPLQKQGINVENNVITTDVDWGVTLSETDTGLLINPKIMRVNSDVELKVTAQGLPQSKREIMQAMWGDPVKGSYRRKISKHELNNAFIQDAARDNNMQNDGAVIDLESVVITIGKHTVIVEARWV